MFRTLLNLNGAAPAGRLTTTFYASDFVERNMTRMDLKNITYKHFTGQVQWPFGFGLGYSEFKVQWKNSNDGLLIEVSTEDMLASHPRYYATRRTGSPGGLRGDDHERRAPLPPMTHPTMCYSALSRRLPTCWLPTRTSHFASSSTLRASRSHPGPRPRCCCRCRRPC